MKKDKRTSQNVKVISQQALISNRDFFSIVENFLKKREKGLFWFTFFLTIVFGLLLFDLKISVGGDDSGYIVRAVEFIQEGRMPTFQAPLYPLFLSIFVFVVGTNLIVLKLLSLLLTVGALYFFYRAFKNRIPAFILVLALLVSAVNSYMLYFASQTYSEAFFLFLQMLFMFYFLNFYEKLKERDSILKEDYKSWILIGFLMFLMFSARFVGVGAVIALVIFFLFDKKFKSAAFSVIPFLIFTLSWESLKKLIWDLGVQVQGQASLIFLKDTYNVSKGNEDFFGMVDRFIQNSHLYISKHLMKFLGLRSHDVTTTNELITIVIYVLLITFLIFAFRKNKVVFFSGVYFGIMLAITFVTLNIRWDQERMIIIYLPLILVFFSYGIYELFRLKFIKKLQPLVLLLFIVITFSVFSQTTAKVKKNLPVLRKNLRGDVYFGYTTDWVNYLKMGEWVGENLSDNSFVACRKPTMATIYAGGKKFYGIYRIPTTDADTLLNVLLDKNVTHVIMANLRRNSKKNTGYTVNTVQRYLGYIIKKYPGKFRQIHQIGNSEPAYLFEIIQ